MASEARPKHFGLIWGGRDYAPSTSESPQMKHYALPLSLSLSLSLSLCLSLLLSVLPAAVRAADDDPPIGSGPRPCTPSLPWQSRPDFMINEHSLKSH